MTKTIEITEDEYAGFQVQSSFLRAAVYALGGQYEVSFQALEKHGHGKMEMHGDPERGSVAVKVVPGEDEDAPPKTRREATSAKVASSAAKVLRDPAASMDAKAAAASALTQKTGRKRVTG